MNRSHRREFLTGVGRGMLVASVGPVLAQDLGLASVVLADGPAPRLTFGPMEPLVAFMEETPPEGAGDCWQIKSAPQHTATFPKPYRADQEQQCQKPTPPQSGRDRRGRSQGYSGSPRDRGGRRQVAFARGAF